MEGLPLLPGYCFRDPTVSRLRVIINSSSCDKTDKFHGVTALEGLGQTVNFRLNAHFDVHDLCTRFMRI